MFHSRSPLAARASRRRPCRRGHNRRERPTSPPRRRGQAVREIAEFDIEVEDALGHRPAKSAIASELGAGVVGDEENVRARRVRRRRPEADLARPGTGARLATRARRGKPGWAARRRWRRTRNPPATTSRKLASSRVRRPSSRSAQPLKHRMIDAIDQAVTKGDLEQIPIAAAPAMGFGYGARCFESFVCAEVHVRFDPNPSSIAMAAPRGRTATTRDLCRRRTEGGPARRKACLAD